MATIPNMITITYIRVLGSYTNIILYYLVTRRPVHENSCTRGGFRQPGLLPLTVWELSEDVLLPWEVTGLLLSSAGGDWPDQAKACSSCKTCALGLAPIGAHGCLSLGPHRCWGSRLPEPWASQPRWFCLDGCPDGRPPWVAHYLLLI